jgi:hypothetical protein
MTDVSDPEPTGPTIHKIEPYAVPDWLARIAKLSKKSMKLLGKPITPVFHGTFDVPYQVKGQWRDQDGNAYIRVLHQYSVEAENPKIKGWTFVATLDHSMVGGNLLRVLPGAAPLPERFRSVEPNCDHCRKKRQRNDTFVLLSDDGKTYKQIGRQCIRDFIGYDVEAIAQSAVWLSECLPSESDGDEGYGGGGRSRDIQLHTFMAHVNAMIRNWGWISGKDAEIQQRTATRSMALSNMFPTKRDRQEGLVKPLTDADFRIATAALEWAKQLPAKDEYQYNIRLIAEQSAIEFRSCGFAASIIPAYARAQDQEIKRAERRKSMKGSEHLGVAKQRLRDIPATVYGHSVLEGDFGTTHVYRFRDTSGNVIIWYASRTQKIDLNDQVLLTGTVKKLETWEGINQTVLSRCIVTAKPDVEPVE